MLNSRSFTLSIFLVLIAILSIQSGASLAKTLFPVLGPEGISTLRLAFATLILGAIWRPWRSKVTRSELQIIAAYGVALGVMNLAFYLALERLPLGLAVALEFSGPLTVALFSSRKGTDFIWVALAVIGIILVLPVFPSSSEVDPIGVAYALGAGVAWALYIVAGKKAGSRIPAGVVTSLGMFVATLVVSPFGVVQSGETLLNPSVLPLAFGVAILSSAVPYSLEMIALKNMPARSFGILMSLEPAVGALIGLAVLNERLSPGQWIAIACIILASAGSSASGPKGLPPVEA